MSAPVITNAELPDAAANHQGGTYREFKYAIRSDICCSRNRGHANFFCVISSNIRGPCCHNAATMVISEFPSFPLPRLGALLEESL